MVCLRNKVSTPILTTSAASLSFLGKVTYSYGGVNPKLDAGLLWDYEFKKVFDGSGIIFIAGKFCFFSL